jgi:hypothetical protein
MTKQARVRTTHIGTTTVMAMWCSSTCRFISPSMTLGDFNNLQPNLEKHLMCAHFTRRLNYTYTTTCLHFLLVSCERISMRLHCFIELNKLFKLVSLTLGQRYGIINLKLSRLLPWTSQHSHLQGLRHPHQAPTHHMGQMSMTHSIDHVCTFSDISCAKSYADRVHTPCATCPQHMTHTPNVYTIVGLKN